MFGLTWNPGGNKLDAGKAKYKHVFRPCPILGNTTLEKSTGFSICCIDCSQDSYSYIILTLACPKTYGAPCTYLVNFRNNK